MEKTPLYQHDCENCKFLGSYIDMDLYVCPRERRPTVICRYSSDGPDYSSGIEFIGFNENLTEAAFRAVSAGYLSVDLVRKQLDRYIKHLNHTLNVHAKMYVS